MIRQVLSAPSPSRTENNKINPQQHKSTKIDKIYFSTIPSLYRAFFVGFDLQKTKDNKLSRGKLLERIKPPGKSRQMDEGAGNAAIVHVERWVLQLTAQGMGKQAL